MVKIVGKSKEINIDKILDELGIKDEFRKKIGHKILEILIRKNIYRWEELETTTGQKSTLLAHSIAVAKNMKVLLDVANVNEDTKEKFILAALSHDICETCYGDVSVGERKELDGSIIEILKTLPIVSEMKDCEFQKWLKENKLDTIASDTKEVQDLLGLLKIWQTDFSNNPDALEILLIGSSHPLVGFVEKFETNFLYPRPDLTDEIIEKIFKKKDETSFGYDAFQKKCWGASSYFLKPLIEVLKNPDIPEELKQKCLGISYNYVKEILKNEKLRECFYILPTAKIPDLTFEDFKSKVKELYKYDIGEKGLISTATDKYYNMQTNSDTCYKDYSELQYKIVEKDNVSEKETALTDAKKEQTQGVFYQLEKSIKTSETTNIVELLKTHIEIINKKLEDKKASLEKASLEKAEKIRQMQKSTISASSATITDMNNPAVFKATERSAPISKEIPDKTGGLLATIGSIIAQTITTMNNTITRFAAIITTLDRLQQNREQMPIARIPA